MSAARRTAYVLGTWFGTGKFPVAPGTVGSLGAVPLHWLLRTTHPLVHAAVVLGVTGVGIWAAQRIAEDKGDDDPSLVVIDEVAGTLLAMGLVRSRSLAIQLAALGLFRLFDIWKPGLIGKAEHLEPPGVGIMADDLVAGVLAGISARFL